MRRDPLCFSRSDGRGGVRWAHYFLTATFVELLRAAVSLCSRTSNPRVNLLSAAALPDYSICRIHLRVKHQSRGKHLRIVSRDKTVPMTVWSIVN